VHHEDDRHDLDRVEPANGVEPVDDLEGFQTSMARFSSRIRGWLALLLAVMLVVPLGGWLLDELAFRRSGDTVTETLGEDAILADAVVLVRSIGCDGQVSTGSGFVTRVDGDAIVVTNRHVVEGARTVGVRPLEGGQAQAATGYRLAGNADVAVLDIEGVPDDAVALPLGGTPRVGQDVRLVGFPAARPFTSAGTVTEVQGGQLLLELEVDPGASGSPVVDEDGAVVGQVFARTRDGDGVATAGDALRTAVETAEPTTAC
jgi:S1-C subfamily serine protease